MSQHKNKSKTTYHQKGSVVVVQESIEPVEMKPADVLKMINGIRAEIDKIEKNISTAKNNLVIWADAIPKYKAELKKVIKFEEWAINIQESKLRAIVNEIKEEVYKKIDETYVSDAALTDEQNNAQRFKQYQMSISTHEKVAEEIVPMIYKRLLFTDSILENPWKTTN